MRHPRIEEAIALVEESHRAILTAVSVETSDVLDAQRIRRGRLEQALANLRQVVSCLEAETSWIAEARERRGRPGSDVQRFETIEDHAEITQEPGLVEDLAESS